MVNKALRLVLYSIFTISLLFVMPVNIYADSITSSNINGISVVLDEVTFIENKTWTISGGTLTLPRNYYNYNAEIQFDKSYLGYIDITISYSYFARNDTGVANFNGTKVQKVFVNGDKAYLAFGFIANSSTDPLTYNSISYTLNSSDLIEYGLLSDIQTIIDILQDNQDIITDIDSELETVVSNTSLANDYLETLTKMRQWNIPIESYSGVLFLLSNYPNNIQDIDEYNIIDYPLFKFNSTTIINKNYYSPVEYTMIYLHRTDVVNEQRFLDDFNLPSNVSFKSISNVSSTFYIDNLRYRIYKVTLQSNGYGNGNIELKGNLNYLFTMIYFGASSNKNISTEFALRYGLSNSMLENIQLIANGTNASSAASSQSDQANSQLQQDSNTLFQQEDSFKQNMNSAMQNIDTTFTLNNFGSSFMTSAQWVRTQYETLTNNTPFASLITFSLLVGLALIVVGKVYK